MNVGGWQIFFPVRVAYGGIGDGVTHRRPPPAGLRRCRRSEPRVVPTPSSAHRRDGNGGARGDARAEPDATASEHLVARNEGAHLRDS